jgi:5,10-methylenetetrahydromethanopterin reductase
MRVGVGALPEAALDEILRDIRVADELGFDIYSMADEVYHWDAWQLQALAASQTRNIRLSVFSHVVIKQPAYLAQQLITLDRASEGRAELGYSVGSFTMLERFGVDWKSTKPTRRIREAHQVMNALIEDGRVDFVGEFYRHEGLALNVRPVQDHIPLYIGGVRGPRSFELAGEIADGLKTGLVYSNGALEFAADRFRAGATRAGRDPGELRLCAAMTGAICADPEVARRAVRPHTSFYIGAMADDMLERHDVDPESVRPAREAIARGDVAGARSLLPNEVADKLARPVGTPEDWVRDFKEIAALGFNEVVVSIMTPLLVEHWGGEPVDGLLDLEGQLRLIHERVLPEVTGL